VEARRARADAEFLANRLVRFAFGEHAKRRLLTRGQTHTGVLSAVELIETLTRHMGGDHQDLTSVACDAVQDSRSRF
jgi:hypothetical protein